MDSFESLGLAEPLSAALASFGFAGPTPIQALAIPLLLARRDAFLESETGTGKTFAYLAPAFQALFSDPVAARRGSGEPGILVVAPTQELAVQIGREAEKLAKAAGLPLRAAVLLGGTPLDKLAAKLRERPDLVVGTLGRLGDLVSLGKLKLGSLSFLVLDEVDRLLAPETAESAMALVKGSPEGCARILVSATIPERFRAEMRPLLQRPAEPIVKGESVLSGSIEHWCFYCDGRKRLDFVRRFEAAVKPQRCLLFMSQAGRVEGAAERLASIGLPIAAIHAGLEKEERRVALERFAEGEIRYLLTSDLGARGLDIPSVSHIISLDLPEEPTVYTHRAGRTGRAGASGISIVLADMVELKRASKIATKGGFVFRCKVLESGAVYEPSPEDFFAAAEAAEDDRRATRLAESGPGERRAPRPRAPRSGDRDAPRPDRAPRPADRDAPSSDRQTQRADGGAPNVYRVSPKAEPGSPRVTRVAQKADRDSPRPARDSQRTGRDASRAYRDAPRPGRDSQRVERGSPRRGRDDRSYERGAPNSDRGARNYGRGAPSSGPRVPNSGRGAPDSGHRAPSYGKGAPHGGRPAPRRPFGPGAKPPRKGPKPGSDRGEGRS
jgi:superfamily II DNA/RNA helicase